MAAPFRIRKRFAAAGDETSSGLKDYLERLLKLIPGEVVGIYLIGVGLIPTTYKIPLTTVPGLWGWTGICLVLVLIARAYGTADPKPQWLAVFVALVSFVIWVYTIGGPFAASGLYVSWLGSLLVLVWTFLVPYFYKG